MIADAAITSAKIAALDAGKVTTGTLNAARIGAKSIIADKLATNAIQVGLAGWASSIRLTPTQISWYSGSSLEGTITSSGLRFWYGTRYIGEMARRAKKDATDIQGIVNQLAYRGALRTATVVFYLSNEDISLIENSTRLGLPVPDQMRRALDLVTRDVTGKPDLEHHPSQNTPAEKENL